MTKPVFRRLHPDFHNPPEALDVGAQFNGDDFAEAVVASGADSVVVFAKDHNGYAYWDTTIGRRHPHLAKKDLFGEAVEACRRRDLTVLAYYSCLVDNVAAETEDWRQQDSNGTTPMLGPYRHVCPNSGYLEEYLLAQMAEVTARYPIDGWHVDIIYFGSDACWCRHCRALMAKSRIDHSDSREVWQFRSAAIEQVVRRMTETVRRRREGLILSYNNLLKIGCERLVRWADIVDVEVSFSWAPQGYADLFGRHIRSLGRTFALTACSRAGGYGSYGTLTSAAQLKYEMAMSMALGGHCQIVNELLPDGTMPPETITRIREVFDFVKDRQEWCTDVQAVPCAAIMGVSRTEINDKEPAAIWGAVRILSESHIPFTVVDETADIRPYRVVVIPEVDSLSCDVWERLKKYVENGGVLFLTGCSVIAEGPCATITGELLGINPCGQGPNDLCYLRLSRTISCALPRMDRAVRGSWAAVKAAGAARSLARVVLPQFPDGRVAASWGNPPQRGTSEYDAVVINSYGAGQTVYVCCPLFAHYAFRPDAEQGRFIGNLLQQAIPHSQRPLVVDLPPSARVSLLSQGHRWVCHLLRGDLRPGGCKDDPLAMTGSSNPATPFTTTTSGGQMGLSVAEPSPVRDVRVLLRPPFKPQRVYLVPGNRELNYVKKDAATIEAVIPQVGSHTILVVE